MKVALVHIGCGRYDYQAATLQSLLQNVRYPWSDVICVNDLERNGWWWSIEQAWQQVRQTDADYVFHLEDDWLFNRPVDVDELVHICESDYNLANVVLRRQAMPSEPEGGYIGADPFGFIDRGGYLEHSKGFWLNPCLYPAEVPRRYQWPPYFTEGQFTQVMLEDSPSWRFAVYGGKNDEPVVHHIGERSAIFGGG